MCDVQKVSFLKSGIADADDSLRDSFDAADAIKSISPEVFSQGHDVESLFTNVPLSKTIIVVLDRIYSKNL